MNRRFLFLLCASALWLMPKAASACSICYGNSDSPLARALGWGVISLLVVVLAVLGGISAFFVYTAKRAAALEQAKMAATVSDPTKKVS